MNFNRYILLALVIAFPFKAHSQDIKFIGSAFIDGKGSDLSGLPTALLEDNLSPANGLNGFGSALAYTGFQNRYVLLADRGPNKIEYKGGEDLDNTTSYQTRFQTFDIQVSEDISKSTGFRLDMKMRGTILFKNSANEQYIGLSKAYQSAGTINRRLDPEGIRIAPDGSVWISDEYGPHILHFDQFGHEIEKLDVPEEVTIANPAPNAKVEMQNNKRGRVTNRGAEGIALTPDGHFLVVAMQSPLIQDGGLKGLNSRLLIYDLKNKTNKPKQFIYQLDDTKMAISEILAVDNNRFLVNERDGVAGPTGRKYLYLIDINQNPMPTELSNAGYGTSPSQNLPETSLPQGIVALQKSLFADIGNILNNAERNGLTVYANSRGLPDKFEGYSWGPALPNGDNLLLASNDNDFETLDTGFPNYVFAFAIPQSKLSGVIVNQLMPGVTFQP